MENENAQDALEIGVDEQLGNADQASATEAAVVEQTGAAGEPAQEQGNADPAATEEANADSLYAAARRRAEADLEKKIQLRDAEFARRCQGQVNPKTGKPITNEREYWEALDAQAEIQQRNQLKEAGVDDTLVNMFIANQQAAKEAEQLRQTVEQIQQSEILRDGEAKLTSQLKEISKLDPAIKQFDDLTKMENFPLFDQLVKERGMDLVSAYKVANFEAATQKRAAAAKQAALNAVNGKNHLQPTGNQGTAEEAISEDRINAMKEFFPNATRAELIAKCKKAQG